MDVIQEKPIKRRQSDRDWIELEKSLKNVHKIGLNWKKFGSKLNTHAIILLETAKKIYLFFINFCLTNFGMGNFGSKLNTHAIIFYLDH